MATDTIDKLLTEHALGRAPQLRYDLSVGATVIVDEAAMVATHQHGGQQRHRHRADAVQPAPREPPMKKEVSQDLHGYYR